MIGREPPLPRPPVVNWQPLWKGRLYISRLVNNTRLVHHAITDGYGSYVASDPQKNFSR